VQERAIERSHLNSGGHKAAVEIVCASLQKLTGASAADIHVYRHGGSWMPLSGGYEALHRYNPAIRKISQAIYN
jgi:hypothetical protein